MPETNQEPKTYITTREECAVFIQGVCEGCGGKLEPIETVDNADRPTFWVGCKHCSHFRTGVAWGYFKIARMLVKTDRLKVYSHMQLQDYRKDKWSINYYFQEQTAALALQIRQIHRMIWQVFHA